MNNHSDDKYFFCYYFWLCFVETEFIFSYIIKKMISSHNIFFFFFFAITVSKEEGSDCFPCKSKIDLK